MKECIRCHQQAAKEYDIEGLRFYCLRCGFTFHRDSRDEAEELKRRRDNE